MGISVLNKSFLKSYQLYNQYYFNYWLKSFNFYPINLNFSSFIGKIITIRYLNINTDELLISNFIGLCISSRNNSFLSSFILRNLLKKDALEFRFFLFSPVILNIFINNHYKKKYRLYKLYFLRNY
jgi:ribosomal protein L19